jgi:probable HAF family extracellular repeat protein
VGYSTQSDGSYRGFTFINGTLTAIPPLSSNYGTAYGVNASGQVIGNSLNSSGIAAGFIFRNGTLTDLGNLGGDDGTSAAAINRLGQVVGYSYDQAGDFLAFLWRNGKMKSLGTLGGAWSQAYGINDAGQITGSAYLANNLGPHVFLFSKGKMTDLDSRSSSLTSWGFGINKTGVIVGQMQVPGGQFVTYHAMIITNGAMKDLNKLIPAGSGWVLGTASGINDAGQIVGYGTLNNQQRAFLLTPQ